MTRKATSVAKITVGSGTKPFESEWRAQAFTTQLNANVRKRVPPWRFLFHQVQKPGEQLAARAEEEAEDRRGLQPGWSEALSEGDRRQSGTADGEAEETHRSGVGHDFLAVERDGSELNHSYLRPTMVACGGWLVKRRRSADGAGLS